MIGLPVIVRRSIGWDGVLTTVHGTIVDCRPDALQVSWASHPGFVTTQWFDLTNVAAIGGDATPWAARLGFTPKEKR